MRKFLVLLDDSRECLNAMRFAAMRAAKSQGAAVVILSVIPAEEIQHGFGVADVMRAEARERIEAHFEVFAKWMRSRPGVEPELVIREGDTAEELLAQITEDGEIGVVVLGLSSDKSSTNPVLTRLMRDPTALPCAISLVPGDLSKERLEAIT
ncbi:MULTISPECIES: universal stress protein [Paracoccus]|jgi:nucleotide-binding universal stress UspA family protein|uniref:Universal stress protein n=2 Tax=Paracoccus TaxID=265 RepID=A0A5C4R2S4_9RHOB|nr:MULTISPECIES: universal stress protein [Paracoccus]TYP68281.1 universal stress protein family protein [Stutzerimonas stutzeri]AZY94963.1 universal stress protein [Paracoccus sp. Arc7-R13]KIX16776.1 universal stress protein [Paracoccus sp. 228]KJZ31820.1 universal stress protein [Paracoccus sp. S4493]MCO6363139.1 universal stress protein [Paracoccus sp. 08]|tara:strand:- start:7536 stop:7994 length:459 start_codon:yes stop_codon:yes gene_type:complete